VSELTTLSITVTVAPPSAGGLAAFVVGHLPAAAPKERDEGLRSVVNEVTGDVHGTVIQIGRVRNMNMPDGR